MHFPFYSATPVPPPEQAAVLPLSRRDKQSDPAGYLPDEELADAVNVALLLGQPLLLTGEPGTGKTQLAYHMAYQLGLHGPLKFETKSNSTARDLFYFYNHLGHFHAAQSKKQENTDSREFLTYNALGLAILLANHRRDVEPLLPTGFDQDMKQRFGEHFALDKPLRSVVLLDEIDKAPRDFPNDILNEVENLYFRIPEMGNRRIQARPDMQPVLIMTSNSEKHLPDAFMRRCIYYHIPFPDERLSNIIEARLGSFAGTGNAFLQDAIALFKQIRKSSHRLNKKPSTAELLGWLEALREIFAELDNPLRQAERQKLLAYSMTPLIKNTDDRETAADIINAWLDKNHE
ncbi:MAG: AAA domain-containing protein [Gammaproteobacteria bacterium]|nr:AAA domain-containing protein [Gammaproteobacteria bacterium]